MNNLPPVGVYHARRGCCRARGRLDEGVAHMIWTIVAILVVLWLLGFIGHVGGGLIHLLLVIALFVFIWNMVVGRRRG